jgi:hypothetical protein
MVTSSPSFVEPPPISSTSIVSDSSSSLTERPPSPASIPSTLPPLSPAAAVGAVIVPLPPPVEVVIPECPPASALFDDELPQDTTDEDEVAEAISEPKPASLSSPLPSTNGEIRESAPPAPQTAPVSPLPPVPHPPSSPSPPPSPIVEHVIPERAATPVASITVEPEPEPEAHPEAEAERPAAAPQKVKLSLQAWKMKKQAEKRQQQRAGHTQAQTGRERGLEVGNVNVNVNGGASASAQASPMSVNSALGGGEDEQGTTESCKGDVEMVRPPTATATATATATTTTSIAAPIAKLELNGYHGPPLLLGETGSHRETLEWLIRVETSHLGSGYAFVCEDSTCGAAFGVADGTGLGVQLLSFAFAFGRLCAASSYEIVEEFQCSSSAAGRWRDQRFVVYHYEFKFETRLCPSSCPSSRYIQHPTFNPRCVTTSSQPPPCTLHGAVAPSSCSRSPWTRQEVASPVVPSSQALSPSVSMLAPSLT